MRQLAKEELTRARPILAYVHDTTVNVAKFFEAKHPCAVSTIVKDKTLEHDLAASLPARRTGDLVQSRHRSVQHERCSPDQVPGCNFMSLHALCNSRVGSI